VTERRTIEIGALARVEGALHLVVDEGAVREVRLSIYEPPRLFEAFLRGRSYRELPDLVARICGICPVAYQMSALHALEQAFDVELDPSVRELRRLYYAGEWIESHLLHMMFLAGPASADSRASPRAPSSRRSRRTCARRAAMPRRCCAGSRPFRCRAVPGCRSASRCAIRASIR
jgi:coenzyme F420-reducing hydrogenase alpha subunit